MKTKKKHSLDLGLTTETWESTAITLDDPDYAQVAREASDPRRWADSVVERCRELGERVLREANLPSTFEAIADPGTPYPPEDMLPHNAVLARRILSTINQYRLRVQSDREAMAFAAGFELAEWMRTLLMNLEYEAPVRRDEKRTAALPQARAASAKKRRKITLELLNKTASIKSKKARAAKLGVSRTALNNALKVHDREK
jgi:hypothetical protein